ncbi:hypothetical protein E2C01_071729 [Portunus trituberculatus]|uniref:Uncharacterized protein n=1 Tax=Portunus trituberculatus TaxID=210409 RepID=A0A5B7I8S2_PORTR|nr:hypothetical protein [Portunus trituberculatus]
MVAVTRSKCALEHACKLLRLSTGVIPSHYNTELREHIKLSQNISGNNFRERYLPDVTVPAKAIELEPSFSSSYYSPDNVGYLSSIMEGIIKGVRDSPFRHRCVMVGGYPTFLLGKTEKFGGVDFLFVHQPQADNVSFFVQVASVLARHLNPDIIWFFEACCELENNDNNYSITMHGIHLTGNAHMMFVTKARDQGHINASRETMTINTLKLSFEGIHVANFCFVGLFPGEKRLTVNGATAIDSIMCVNQAKEQHNIVTGVINKICDSGFVMAAAHFEDHGDTHLYCVDVSFKSLIDQVDNKYIPMFFPHNERRAKKYGCRVSRMFKRHIKAQRKLMY